MSYTIQLSEPQLQLADFNLGQYTIQVELYSPDNSKLFLVNNLETIFVIKDIKEKLNIKSGTVLNVTNEGIIDLTPFIQTKPVKSKNNSTPRGSGASSYIPLSLLIKNN